MINKKGIVLIKGGDVTNYETQMMHLQRKLCRKLPIEKISVGMDVIWFSLRKMKTK